MKTTLSRRRLLQVLGALGVGAVAGRAGLGQVTPPLPGAPNYRAPRRPRGLSDVRGAYTFFTMPEARFVEAAVARIIPADDLGPGALEAGVPYFIDQQLQGKFGLAAKWYMQGPWEEGEPEQGFQLPLSPQEIYRVGIPAVDVLSEERFGATFADLSGGDQDGVLSALEAGDLALDEVPARVLETFWSMLLGNTQEGFFADPAYGGNQDKVGWRLVGFPGVAAAYRGVIEPYYGISYDVEPVSIADIQQGRAEADATGHAVHRDRLTGETLAGGHSHPEGFDHDD